jgi:RAQPRD family integrative conjugative element protein
MVQPRFLAPFCLLLVLASALPARADHDAERDALARIAQDLKRVQDQVRTASRQAEGAQRVRFEYAYLERDLELVRRGIEEHLDAPRQPRPIPPLSGDYRH